jgi:hypothetical protein
LDNWVRVWFESGRQGVAPETLANERSHARLYLGSLGSVLLAEITPGVIDDWLDAIERAGVAGATLARAATHRRVLSRPLVGAAPRRGQAPDAGDVTHVARQAP